MIGMIIGDQIADVIKQWVQDTVWTSHGVWLDGSSFWLNLVSPDDHNHVIRK